MFPNSKSFVLLPEEVWDELSNKINFIFQNLKPGKAQLEDYYSEKEVREILDKKSTAMWELEKSGKLPCYKVGKKKFYKKTDLIDLIEKSKNT
jgi:hypothetical protein